MFSALSVAEPVGVIDKKNIGLIRGERPPVLRTYVSESVPPDNNGTRPLVDRVKHLSR